MQNIRTNSNSMVPQNKYSVMQLHRIHCHGALTYAFEKWHCDARHDYRNGFRRFERPSAVRKCGTLVAECHRCCSKKGQCRLYSTSYPLARSIIVLVVVFSELSWRGRRWRVFIVDVVSVGVVVAAKLFPFRMARCATPYYIIYVCACVRPALFVRRPSRCVRVIDKCVAMLTA